MNAVNQGWHGASISRKVVAHPSALMSAITIKITNHLGIRQEGETLVASGAHPFEQKAGGGRRASS